MAVSGYNPSYKVQSPYRDTPIIGNFMGYYIHRGIDPQPGDILVTMDNPEFVERPDLLAVEIYGDADLWWVIPVRNGFEDLMHELQLGVELHIPTPDYVRSVL